MEALDKKIPLAGYADGHNPGSVHMLIDTTGFPLVIKERFSRGSKSINIVETYDELIKTLQYYESPLIQEYIDDKFGEFSCGNFFG